MDVSLTDLVGEIADQDWTLGDPDQTLAVVDWRTGGIVFPPDPRLWRQAFWKAVPGVSHESLGRIRTRQEGSLVAGGTSRLEWTTLGQDTFLLVKWGKLKRPLVKSLMATVPSASANVVYNK